MNLLLLRNFYFFQFFHFFQFSISAIPMRSPSFVMKHFVNQSSLQRDLTFLLEIKQSELCDTSVTLH